jgi:NADH-quinone oxidoreductase subunit H
LELAALDALPTTLGQTASLLTLDNFWVSVALKIGVVLAMAFTIPLVGGYLEHKVMGRMQDRRGPVAAGPFGSLQLVADGIKFIQKEDIVPRSADRWTFAMAPGIALVPAILVFFVIPLGPGIWAADLELGLFYALAIGSISVIGIMVAGWASANKFSLIGGIRAGAQLIAYELPLFLAAAAVALQAGSLSLVDIVAAQGTFMLPGTELNLWYVFPQALGFAIFFAAAMAELNRPPFDMPIADSELVFGFMTEYSGIKFAMFLLSEYAGMISMSAIMVVLYLGGWQILPGVPLPGCDAAGGLLECGFAGTVIGVLVTLGKIMALVFVMVWFRVAYPRLREDQLQRMSWLVFIPLSLVNLAIVAIGKVVG